MQLKRRAIKFHSASQLARGKN